VTAACSLASPLRAIADELGELERELAPLKSKIARADALRKLLRGAYSCEAAGESFLVEGGRWVVQLGPKENESTVDKARLVALIGLKDAYGLATISLKALELATPAVRAAVVTTHATGSRKIHLFPAPAPAPVAAPPPPSSELKKAAVKKRAPRVK
jgi:hypothetical protein